MTTALRIPAFRRLAALYAVDFILEWFGTVALMVLVYDATDSAMAATAMLLCKQLAPVFVVPAVSGSIESAAPRVALAGSLAAQAAVVAVFALLGYGWWLFPLAAAAGILGVLFRASLRGTLARSLDARALRSGNAVLNVLVAVGAAAGPALAAWAVTSLGTAGALWVGALGGAVLALGALTVSQHGDVSCEDEDDASEHAAHRAGRTHSALPYGVLLAFAGAVFCVSAMDEPALLAFSKDALQAGVAGYGAIYTAWGVGAAIGSLAFARLLDRPMLAVSGLSGLVFGAAYLGMGLSSSIVMAGAFAVVGGAANGVGFVAVITAIQEAAPRGAEIRAAARLETVSTAAPGVGVLLGGAIAELAGPRFALIVPGAVCIAVILVAAATVRWRARRPYATALLPSTLPGGSV